MRGALGLSFERERDQAFDRVIPDLARRPAAWRIRQAFDPMCQEPLPPGDDALAADAEPCGNAGVGGLRISAGEHDASAHGHILAGPAPPREPQQLCALLLSQRQGNRLRATGQGHLPRVTTPVYTCADPSANFQLTPLATVDS